MDLVLFLCSVVVVLRTCHANTVYSHTWAAHIEGGESVAKSLAEKHGFTYLGKVFHDFKYLGVGIVITKHEGHEMSGINLFEQKKKKKSKTEHTKSIS